MVEQDIQRAKGAFPAELRQIPQQLPERLLRQWPACRQVSLPACLLDFSRQIPAQRRIVRHPRRLGGIFLGKQFRQMLHRRLGQIRPVPPQFRLYARQHLLFSPVIGLRPAVRIESPFRLGFRKARRPNQNLHCGLPFDQRGEGHVGQRRCVHHARQHHPVDALR